jgi:CDP-diacylglycerol---glycerol-3-phosphate 3-phosphatidyltransferase
VGVFTYWPNRITAMRFVGALVLFGIFALFGESSDVTGRRGLMHVCFWLFVVIAATDFLDGYLARRGKTVTAFGRIADPFVDKVLILGAMIFMAVMPWSRPWFHPAFVVIILAREFLVTGIRGYVESLGREFPADRYGKFKMIVQSVLVGSVMWIHLFDWSEPLAQVWRATSGFLVALTLVATLGSGLAYVLRTRQILAEAQR